MNLFYILSAVLLASSAGAKTAHIRIIHTNDLHSSRFLPRLATVIEEAESSSRAQGALVLKFDAGDFFSGTLHSYPSLMNNKHQPIELEFFNALKYDAITLGNHEFDAGLVGFNRLLSKASLSVPIVITTANPKLIESFPGLLFQKKILLRRVGNQEIKIGVLGGMSKSALESCRYTRLNRQSHSISFGNGALILAPKEELKFQDNLQQAINQLRPKVDLLIVLFHGGGRSAEDDEAEDFLFANSIQGVDVFVSGHSHASYFRKSINNIPLMQSEYAGREAGVYDFTYDLKTHKITDEKHEFHSTADAKEQSDFLNPWQLNKKSINQLLEQQGTPFQEDSHVAIIRQNLPWTHEINDPFATRVMSTILHGLNDFLKKQNPNEKPVELYFSAQELSIREPLRYGESYNFGEIVQAISGEGFSHSNHSTNPQFKHGFPIVTFYLTGYEISTLISALVNATRDMPDAVPAFSGNVVFSVNERGWLFGNMKIIGEISHLTINRSPIDYKKRYKVATNLFLAENLFFRWHEKINIPGLSPLLGYVVGLHPTDKNGKVYDLNQAHLFQNLAASQHLPPEYEVFARRLAKNNGHLDD